MKKFILLVTVLFTEFSFCTTAFAADNTPQNSNTWVLFLFPAVLVAVIIIFIIKIAKARKKLNIKSDVFKDIQDGKVNSDHQYINKKR